MSQPGIGESRNSESPDSGRTPSNQSQGNASGPADRDNHTVPTESPSQGTTRTTLLEGFFMRSNLYCPNCCIGMTMSTAITDYPPQSTPSPPTYDDYLTYPRIPRTPPPPYSECLSYPRFPRPPPPYSPAPPLFETGSSSNDEQNQQPRRYHRSSSVQPSRRIFNNQ